MADTRKYLSDYISVADLEDGPLVEVIVDVGETKFGRPELTLKSGRKFSVNNTNLRTLHAFYGTDDANWPGIKLRFVPGKIKFGNEDKDSVLIEPITQRIVSGKPKSKPLPMRPRGDEIYRPPANEDPRDDGAPFPESVEDYRR